MNIKKATSYILNEIDIVQYSTEIMGFSYKKYGKNLRTVCPLHSDSDPSLSVTIGKQVWHCFGCKKGGTLISLVEEYYNLNRIQSIIKIFDDLSIDKSIFQDEKSEIVGSEIMETAQSYFKEKALESNQFSKYFINKGFNNINEIIKVGVGYSNNKDKLVKFLISKQVSEEDIWAYDLNNECFNNSIVYPIYNQYGDISYFKCRLFGSDIKNMSSNISIPTYNEDVFLGVHSLKKADDVVIVEGDSDWLALHLKGYNVIAMGGLKLNENILDIIKAYEIRNVYIWTDGDQAGWKFIEGMVDDYGKLFCKRNLNGRVIFVDHTDPDEAILTGFNLRSAMDMAEIIPAFYIERKYSDANINKDYKKSYDMIDFAIRLVDDYDNTTIEYFIHYLHHRTGFELEAIRDKFIEQTDITIHNHKYEQHIISYMLDYPEVAVQYGIKEDWFVLNASKYVYRLIKDKNINRINLVSHAPVWLNSYIEGLPIVDESSVGEYIGVIKDLYQRRTVSNIAKDILRKNTNFDDSLSYLNEAVVKLYKDSDNQLASMTQVTKQITEDFINKVKVESMQLGPGWERTNHILHGIRPKKLMLVMGNTGHGKTTLVLNWMYWLSIEQSYRGLIFSGEMDEREVTERLIAISTGISATDVTIGNVGDNDIDKIFEMTKKIEGDTIHIHNTMDVDHIFNVIRYAKIKHDINYVVLDYLQLTTPAVYMKGMSRTQQLKEVTRRMKVDVCDELGLPAIIVGQLSDQGLDDATPQARRSSESKLIQADADVTIAMRRKNNKELELDPIGNIIYHIDKVRYNRSSIILPLHVNDSNLFMTEVGEN